MPATLRNHQYLTSFVADRVKALGVLFREVHSMLRSNGEALRRAFNAYHLLDADTLLERMTALIPKLLAESTVFKLRAAPLVEAAEKHSEQVRGSAVVMGCYETDDRYVAHIMNAVCESINSSNK